MIKLFTQETGVTAACIIPFSIQKLKVFYAHKNIIFYREMDIATAQFSSPVELFESPTNACVSAMRLTDDSIMFVRKTAISAEMEKLKLGGANHHCLILDESTGDLNDLGQIEQDTGCYYIMNDRLLRLTCGRLLLPEACHPIADYNKELETAGVCACARSDDNGQTWHYSNWIKASDTCGHLAEPMVVSGKNPGTVFMFMRNVTGFLHMSTSYDNGESWSAETATAIRMPCAPFTVKRDPFSGYVFLVWDNAFPAPQYQYPRSPVCLAVSRDDCATWEFVCELDNDPFKSYGYPAIHFLPDKLIISYYESPGRTFQADAQRLKINILQRNELQIKGHIYNKIFE